MAVEGRANIDTTPFVLDGISYGGAITLLQDAGRTTDMVIGTVLSQDPATEKFVPFSDETAVDGTEIPIAILDQTIPSASLVAGDVTDVAAIWGPAVLLDINKIVVENSKTLATVIASLKITVKQALRWSGIFLADTENIDAYENA
jgi:hypothetical protein